MQIACSVFCGWFSDVRKSSVPAWLNFLRSHVGSNISPLRSWQKNRRRDTALIHTSKPQDRLRPLFKSSSIEIVMGARLERKEEGGRSSSTPLMILLKWALPDQRIPHLSCSFLIANSFAPTVFPARRPAKDKAQARSTSSLAGSVSAALIPSLSQKDRYSRRWLASFLCVVLFRMVSWVFLIFSSTWEVALKVQSPFGVQQCSVMECNSYRVGVENNGKTAFLHGFVLYERVPSDMC